MEQIRLVALDLDGNRFQRPKRDHAAHAWRPIRAALQKGVTVLPATGRTADGVPEQFTGIPGVRYALTSNGASVVDLQTGEQLVSLPFAPDLARRTYRALLPFGGMLSIFIGGKSYTTREKRRTQPGHHPAQPAQLLPQDAHRGGGYGQNPAGTCP